MQDRVLDAADILIDRQPVIRRFLVHRLFGVRMSQKRAKYQEESTKVSSVSVSRVAGPPQTGQVRVFHVGSASSGLPLTLKVRSSRAGAPADRIPSDRHHAAFGAMDHRDRTTPGPLARHQPVAQAVIHRALARAGLFQPRRDFGLGLLHRHAVEEARIGELARADIGLVADVEALGIGAFRHHDRQSRASRYLRAKSRSRWSCAGQPKIAPVP